MFYYFFQNKFNIQEQLKKYFQSQLKLLTTPCIISETEKLGIFSAKVYGATQIVKQFAIHRCRHEKKPLSGSNCLLSMIGKDNSSRYTAEFLCIKYIYYEEKYIIL